MWDHAAGKVVLECAGGCVGDLHGKTLDFAHGDKLSENYGILATMPELKSLLENSLSTICNKKQSI